MYCTCAANLLSELEFGVPVHRIDIQLTLGHNVLCLCSDSEQPDSAAAQGAAIMTRHDCWCECSFGIQDVVITPHALEQGGSIRCSLCSDYEPMRAVQNRCTGTTHSGPG